MADRLNWSQGKRGKGLVLHNGDIHTWNVNALGAPEHGVYRDTHNLGNQPAFWFNVQPTGALHDNDLTYNNQTGQDDQVILNNIMAADQRHFVPSKDDKDDEWALDPNGPPDDKPEGIDYNFIMSSTEESDDYAAMLKEWLDDLPGYATPAPVSPHHDSLLDVLPSARVSPSQATALYPPGNEPEWAKQAADDPKEPYPDGDPEVARPGQWVVEEGDVLPEDESTPWLSKLLRRRR